MQMQEEYSLENEHLRSAGKSRGHFMIDLCRPVHLTLCLRSFQEAIHCTDDNWDAQFGALLHEEWDLVNSTGLAKRLAMRQGLHEKPSLEHNREPSFRMALVYL